MDYNEDRWGSLFMDDETKETTSMTHSTIGIVHQAVINDSRLQKSETRIARDAFYIIRYQ